MTDITPNHPAVEAAARELAQLDAGDPWPSNDDLGGHHILGTRDDEYRFAMLEEARAVLNTVLPHLTADDLRNTDAAEEIRTEGWLQGWAAGRDLDGDEDAIPYLRNTPAGRALMAEGWDALIESMSASGEFHDVDLRTMERLNPYRGGDA